MSRLFHAPGRRPKACRAGSPQGFDASYLRHQLPGGMVGTMRRHLAEMRVVAPGGRGNRGDSARVREELGWPIVMTPFSQILLTQAVMNVTGRERYAAIPDELIRYALGRFGKPTVPIDPQVMDRIESSPRAAELRAEPAMASLAELRRRLGAKLSDEEFLLRATMPSGQVDAMLASGPAARHYDPSAKPVIDLIRALTARRDLWQVSLEKAGFKLELRREPAELGTTMSAGDELRTLAPVAVRGCRVRRGRHAAAQRSRAGRLRTAARGGRSAVAAALSAGCRSWC